MQRRMESGVVRCGDRLARRGLWGGNETSWSCASCAWRWTRQWLDEQEHIQNKAVKYNYYANPIKKLCTHIPHRAARSAVTMAVWVTPHPRPPPTRATGHGEGCNSLVEDPRATTARLGLGSDTEMHEWAAPAWL